MNTTEYGVYYENECPFQTYILQMVWLLMGVIDTLSLQK